MGAGRWTAVLVLGGLLALPACSDDGGGGDGEATASSTAGLTEAEEEVVETALAWIDDEADLDDEVRESLRFRAITTNPAVTNVAFGQVVDDHPVEGAELVVHVLADGSVQGASDALTAAEPAEEGEPVDAAEAEDAAGKAVDGTPSEVGPSELVWLPSGDELVLAWSVPVTTQDPAGSWAVLVAAGSGEVVDVTDGSADRARHVPRAPWSPKRPARTVLPATARLQAGGDACDPGPPPSACLFLPDPIYAAGGERPEVGQANEFLEGRPLENLDDPDGGLLVGAFVDTDPSDATVASPIEEDGTWAAGRARPGLEHAMSYYWIDTAHGVLDRLGFGDVWDRPVPVEAVDADLVDNAQWDGRSVRMGVGSDGINEGEDASGIVHEYGHAVLDEMAPSLFNSAEGGAYHEGFADLLAYFVTLEERTGDQACLFPWTEEGQCLRRLDTDLVHPDDLQNAVHHDGTIYTGAVWDVFEALLAEDGIDIDDCPGSDTCAEVADRVLATVLTSHGYLVEGTTLPDVAAAFVSANEAAFGGADEELIAAAFDAHGLAGGGTSSMDPTGEIDEPEEGVIAVEFEITHSYRGDLDVEVGVLDEDGEALCDPVSLHRPDRADGQDDLTGLADVSETDCADHAPPSADRQWYLRAVDTLAEDEGAIVGFTVYDGEDPYRAGGLPQAIADDDPAGTTVVVDGSSGDGADPADGMIPDGDDAGDAPTFAFSLSHSYVGDLSIRAGTADDDGDVRCAVAALAPDPGARGDGGLEGRIDLSECEDDHPPTAEIRWFFEVVDTAAVDEGTLDELTLAGPDGDEIAFEGLPVTIPDDDPDGLLLLTDGDRAEPVAGAGGRGAAPELGVDIEHPYAGDLAVEVGAVDADGEVLCQVPVATPDPADSAPGLQIEERLDRCADAFPPQGGRRWYLEVVDTLARDTGRLIGATLTGADGETYVVGGPTPIPDADPTGVVAFFAPA